MSRIQIKRIITEMVAENCYVIHKENRAIIVDPGEGFEKIRRIVEDELKVEVEAIILTHAHFDHIAGLEECRVYFDVPVYVAPEESEWLINPELNGSTLFGLSRGVKTSKKAEFEFEKYKTYELAGMNFKVLPTPGHSPGGVSFDFGNFIVVGDALFRSGFGRYDLPGSDFSSLKNSLHNVLFKLDINKIVYPGHGEETTIGREKDLDLI